MSQGSLTTKVRPPDLQHWSHWAFSCRYSVSKQKQSCVNQIHNPSEKKHRTFRATRFGLKETKVFWGVLSSVLILILDLFSIFYDISCIVMHHYELNNRVIERKLIKCYKGWRTTVTRAAQQTSISCLSFPSPCKQSSSFNL